MAASQSQSDPHRREPGQRRPMCGVCTKPLRLCLCGRLRSPLLDTTVGVTILQHVMEAHHPLNSTRVARLGLRNLAVAQVNDVNHRARFLLRTLDSAGASDLGGEATDPGTGRGGSRNCSDGPGKIDMQNGDGFRCGGERLNLALSRDGICGGLDGHVNATCDFEKTGMNSRGDLGEENVDLAGSRHVGGEELDLGEISNGNCCDLGGEVGDVECFRFEKMKRNEHHADFERPCSAANQIGKTAVNGVGGESHHRREMGVTHEVNPDLPLVENTSEFHMVAVCNCNGIRKENVEVGAAIRQGWTLKNMDKCSIAYTEKELRINIERGVKPKIRWLSRGSLGQGAVSNGFAVTKIQMKKSKLTGEVSEFEEFSITIPPQSALLFPCQRAISIDASDCQVRHLIVLDGTWAKAQRMYHENPWLQLLPHVKLESDRVSLYSEVRHEPRAGCLSTIESIVVAMRKLGEDAKGLDDLLDVFESMIADQRRCKDENWKQKLKSQS